MFLFSSVTCLCFDVIFIVDCMLFSSLLVASLGCTAGTSCSCTTCATNYVPCNNGCAGTTCFCFHWLVINYIHLLSIGRMHGGCKLPVHNVHGKDVHALWRELSLFDSIYIYYWKQAYYPTDQCMTLVPSSCTCSTCAAMVPLCGGFCLGTPFDVYLPR